MVGIRFPLEVKDFSVLFHASTSSGIHSASYTVCSGGFYPEEEETKKWSRLSLMPSLITFVDIRLISVWLSS